MNKLTLEIGPKLGFGELKFGHTIEEVISIVGEAEEIENIEEEEGFNTVILNYWEQGFSVFIEGTGSEKSVVSCVETDNEETIEFKKL